MIYELRTYTLYPGKRREYLELFKTEGLAIRQKYSPLVGYWFSDIGELNQVLQLWSYKDMADWESVRRQLAQDAAWLKGFLPKANAMVLRQQTQILSPAEFSPIK